MCRQVRELEDPRISAFLQVIDVVNVQIALANGQIRDAVKQSSDAQIIKTMPGIGDYSALVPASEIDDIDRFVRAPKLRAYAGIVPSVRSSGAAVHYGPITHRGRSCCAGCLPSACISTCTTSPTPTSRYSTSALRKKKDGQGDSSCCRKNTKDDLLNAQGETGICAKLRSGRKLQQTCWRLGTSIGPYPIDEE